MSSLIIAMICAGCIFGGVVLGFWLQKILPDHHLSKESQDTVKLGSGMVATMAALVLGLLVSSSKSSFDAVNGGIAQFGAKIILLDRVLAGYGPETKEARELVRTSTAGAIARIWGVNGSGGGGLRASESTQGLDALQEKLRGLTPTTPAQQAALAQVAQISSDILQTRLLVLEQEQGGLPPVLLVLLIGWLSLLFVTFGLFAARNVTVFVVFFVCALSVSSAVYLILEMNRPLDGFIRASSAPLIKAVEMIGR
jgi:hypothetical protein